MNLLTLLKTIPDHRRGQAKKFQLAYILLYSIIALCAGANTYKDIERYVEYNLKLLNEKYGTKRKKRPSHSTINYVMMGLNVLALEEVFRQHAKELTKESSKNHIAIDGKTLRGSFYNTAGKSVIQMVSAYLVDSGITLRHEFIEGQKTNEIPIVQGMVEGLPQGAIVTADAMHMQKKR